MLVLTELFDLSDPQTADALRYDIRWKMACGRSLTQVSFDPFTLVYWRKRIAASDRPDRVFDVVARGRTWSPPTAPTAPTGGRIARRVAPDRVISTVDPEARHTRKSKSTRRDGSGIMSALNRRPD